MESGIRTADESLGEKKGLQLKSNAIYFSKIPNPDRKHTGFCYKGMHCPQVK